ncbi:MAG: hypothetical protein RL685_4970 [Pseudomonadota bacterium]|jgi:hypothetical protein
MERNSSWLAVWDAAAYLFAHDSGVLRWGASSG